MKKRLLLVLAMMCIIVTACSSQVQESITLVNQDNEEVSFPQDKPTLFFFITTYTWSLCQQQLVELHDQLDSLKDIDANLYIISKDTPEQSKELYQALTDKFGQSLTVISDPELKMADVFDVKNGDSYQRGYGLLDTNGEVVFSTVNDHWGELWDESLQEIKKEYDKLQ